MELDIKQKVLVAIYTEYQKDIPHMDNAMKEMKSYIESKPLKIALEKLENERYITGYFDKPKSPGSSDMFVHKTFRFLKITRDGISHVEEKLNIDKTLSNKEKVEKIIKSTSEWGFEQLKDMATKVLAEVIKSQV